jgi:EAL domain-containing protein (putative c-di-GMP-specific phosphodiesterase class I)/ActR/RegA family two-component response regulator
MTAFHSVLLIEDSPVQRQHAAELCRELGFAAIHEAGDGVEALRILAQLPAAPGLLLLDLEMPGMDGIELLEQLRQREVKLPIVLVSSREKVLLDAVWAMGCDLGLQMLAALHKPLQPEALRAALALIQPAAAAPLLPRAAIAAPALALNAAMLSAALAAGDIFVHYQPKVDIRTGIVRGVEALARWRHAELGLVPPDQFVALAEREGLILPLTLQVMAQAFQQAERWNQRGLRLSMAVNLSSRVLDQPTIVQQISDLAASCSLRSDQIVLELTEGAVVSPLGPSLSVLMRLRLRGFGLSIDDYGTGFSSMQQLARIPFTELKIDRSFVHGAHSRHSLRVILRSALELARQLDLVCVAEGIETLEDWQLLQEFGCTAGQGWLIAKPMAGEALQGWLKVHRKSLQTLRERVSNPQSTGLRKN